MLVGYARTSTAEQIAGLEAQLRDLADAGATKQFTEQISSVALRERLNAALDFVRDGDVLMVTRLDRLARSTADLLSIIEKLEAKGVALRILDFGGSCVDTKSPSGRLIVTLFGAFAEFERTLMLCRMKEGIAKAKADGKYTGRKPTARAKTPQVLELRRQGNKPRAIATQLRMSRASVYRILGAEQATHTENARGIY